MTERTASPTWFIKDLAVDRASGALNISQVHSLDDNNPGRGTKIVRSSGEQSQPINLREYLHHHSNRDISIVHATIVYLLVIFHMNLFFFVCVVKVIGLDK